MTRLLLTAALLALAGAASAAPPVRVMSFNLRYATAPDGENAWDKRKAFLAETVRAFEPDLLGTQETLATQRDFLSAELPGFEAFAAGRDDGREKGEMAALFFRAARFEKLGGGHFWLSTTPDVPGSKGWDTSLPRVATWVKLKDRLDPAAKPTLFLNTHFDHRGKVARAESAKLVRAKLAELGAGCRLVVTGDFNAGEGSDPYRALFADAAGKASPVVDSYRVSHPERKSEEGTFNGFKPSAVKGDRIDWVGVSRDWDVRLAGIDRVTRGGRTPSDHFPIFAVLRPAQAAKTLRVVSYNIHHGEGTDGKLDLPRVARVIRDADPDLVAVQEVDDKTKRTGGVDQAAELARLTGLHGRFGKAIDYQGGGYGQAILSRFPLGEVKVHQLPGEPEREQRVAVEATVTADGRELAFVTTHLHHASEPFRVGQAKELNKLFADAKHPVILAGDLNATPESEPLKVLGATWTSAGPAMATFPAGVPRVQIDYVLYRPAAAYVAGESRVLTEPVASDHRAILAVLGVPAAIPTATPVSVFPPYTKPTCVAHRGASADAPEHTQAAYDLALKQGADIVEPDLQFTKDGVLVCLHDTTLERTTDVAAKFPDRAKLVKGRKRWPVVDFTLAEVQTLDAGSWKAAKFAGARVATFQQLIDIVKGKAGLLPEIKDAAAYAKLGYDVEGAMMKVLKANGLDRPGADPKTPVIVQSFSADSLKKLRTAGCKLPMLYLFSEADTSPAGLKAIRDFADGLAPNKGVVLANPELVADAHALGMSVTVWTPRAGQTGRFATVKDEMRHFLRDLKVDAVITDNPGDFPRD